ncbi:hypothetical protein [Bacillus atrophaeus]|uniref:hypothetical protein n=1 Tax=Bacillus atrophaeus TaxID=1452 RepID=UPI00255C11C2|nr:hypothetical protein [Bacillus atrophaeus]MDL5143496.1 hypothetical protein [Bacillus atrophaeus]
MKKNFFLEDKHQLKQFKQWVNQTFKTSEMFPDQVFHEQYKYFWFQEFSALWGDDIWDTLKLLANYYSDNQILTAVLDTPPETYRTFSDYYNWIWTPSSLTKEEYSELLWTEPNGVRPGEIGSIQFTTTTVVWLSPSRKWGIWGNIDQEICILGLTDRQGELLGDNKWKILDDGVLELQEQIYQDGIIPNEVKNKIIQNYQMR